MKPHKKPRTGRAQRIVYWVTAAALAFLGLFSIAFVALSRDLPSVEQLRVRQVDQSTKIWDREGKVLLYEVNGGERRTVVPLDRIPQSLKDATIAVEDEKFYTEPGFDLRAIVRAALANLAHGGIVQGGSTITQQLAKKAFLTDDQTIVRKLRELILAVEINRRYTKDQILAFYLNEIPYGPTIYGIEAASEAYFGKHVEELSLAQGALLAALPRAPSYYSPWGSHTKELIARQRFILNKLRSIGKITKQELDAALAEPLVFQPQGQGINAPHFVMAVQDYLVKKYGEDLVRTGGLKVTTTLDWKLQEAAEKAVHDGAERNEKLYKGRNAALVAEDPKTGQILALVGSRDYFDIKNEGNFNVASQGLRQPGSALKPFAYLTGFTKGYVPETVLFDVPTEFASNNPACPALPDFSVDDAHTPCFHPHDFDGKFRGPIPIRTALAQSVNIPAVKMLYLAGMQDTLETLRNFGVSTLSDPSRYGLSLVLGGGEVHLADLVGAYSVLAEEGIHHDQVMVLEVTDSAGTVLESYRDRAERVADFKYVRMVNDILSDINVRSGLFGASLNLTVFPDRDIALKTGTSNDYRDAWTFGYTPSLVAGVWAGNNNNAPLQKSGSSILAAVPIWNAFMVEAVKTLPPESFTRPEPELPEKPVLRGEYMVNNEVHTILAYVDKKDPTGPGPTNPAADPQFVNWEAGVRAWAGENLQIASGDGTASSTPSVGGSPVPEIQITAPTSGEFVGSTVSVTARISAASPVATINLYWNGAAVDQASGPFSQTYLYTKQFAPPNIRPQNLLEVEARTSVGAASRSSVIVYSRQ